MDTTCSGSLKIPHMATFVDASLNGLSTNDLQSDLSGQSLTVNSLEAFQLIQSAQEEAANIVANAYQEALVIRQDALQKGYQEGHQLGFKKGFDEGEEKARNVGEQWIAGKLEELQGMIQKVEEWRKNLLLQLGEIIGRVADASVQKLLQRELMLAPAEIGEIVSELIQYVIESTRVEVRVHPLDFGLATQTYPKWQGMKFGDWDVVIVPDAEIELGGCEIRSDMGRVDGRVQTKLALLQPLLHEMAERSVIDYADIDA